MGEQIRNRSRTTRNEHGILNAIDSPGQPYRLWVCPDCGSSGTLKQVTRLPCQRGGSRSLFDGSAHPIGPADAS